MKPLAPAGVDIGGVDEIATGGTVGVQDLETSLLVRGPAKRIAAEGERKDLEPARPEREPLGDRTTVVASVGRSVHGRDDSGAGP